MGWQERLNINSEWYKKKHPDLSNSYGIPCRGLPLSYKNKKQEIKEIEEIISNKKDGFFIKLLKWMLG